jgi:hypothetical protein
MVQLATAAAAPPMQGAAAPPSADPAGAPPSAPEGAGDESEEQPNASPEEQKAYETFVTNGLQAIYSGGEGDAASVRPDILEELRQGDNFIANLANATVKLVVMLQSSAKKANHQIDDAVLMHGAQALLEELAEVSDAAKIHTFTEKEIEAAWYKGLDLWRSTGQQSGDINADQLKGEFQQIQQADQQGRMGDVLPQLGSQAGGKTPPTPADMPENQGGQ